MELWVKKKDNKKRRESHTEQQVHPLHPEAAWPQVLQ
jgi:hypothetical protein